MKVIHFSGGKTSAYMTIRYYQPGDIVIFCDTQKEHEGTYKFIDQFERIEKIPIIKQTYPGGWMELIRKQQMVPNYAKRKCTQELKIKTARRYLRSIGVHSYIQMIGFRSDEKHRSEKYKNRWKKVRTEFPLIQDQVTKNDVNEYWSKKTYNLDIPEILGNCDLCFLKGVNAIIAILTTEPHRADKWIEEEESSKNKYTFHKGITMRELKKIAIESRKKFDIKNIKPDFNCSCFA